MSPALYADEEGRATMTRNVEDPFVSNRKKLIRATKGVSRGTERERKARAWHQHALSLPLPTGASLPRHAYVLRIHTLTCHHRVETELIEVNLLLSLPSLSFPTLLDSLVVQGSQVERAVVIGRGT